MYPVFRITSVWGNAMGQQGQLSSTSHLRHVLHVAIVPVHKNFPISVYCLHCDESVHKYECELHLTMPIENYWHCIILDWIWVPHCPWRLQMYTVSIHQFITASVDTLTSPIPITGSPYCYFQMPPYFANLPDILHSGVTTLFDVAQSRSWWCQARGALRNYACKHDIYLCGIFCPGHYGPPYLCQRSFAVYKLEYFMQIFIPNFWVEYFFRIFLLAKTLFTQVVLCISARLSAWQLYTVCGLLTYSENKGLIFVCTLHWIPENGWPVVLFWWWHGA